MCRRRCCRSRLWSGFPLVRGGIIQQNNHRAAQMPQQFTQKPADLLLPDVVKEEQIVEAQPMPPGAQRNSGNDGDLVPPPLAMTMDGSLALRSPGPDHVGNRAGSPIHRQRLCGRPAAQRFFYPRPVFLFPALDGFFIPLQRAPFRFLQGSIADCASTGRHGRGDTGLRTPAGSLPQCGPWSTDWFGSPARVGPLQEQTHQAFSLRLGPASAGGRERSAPAKPWLRPAAGHPASASPNWHGIRCAAPLR